MTNATFKLSGSRLADSISVDEDQTLNLPTILQQQYALSANALTEATMTNPKYDDKQHKQMNHKFMPRIRSKSPSVKPSLMIGKAPKLVHIQSERGRRQQSEVAAKTAPGSNKAPTSSVKRGRSVTKELAAETANSNENGEHTPAWLDDVSEIICGTFARISVEIDKDSALLAKIGVRLEKILLQQEALHVRHEEHCARLDDINSLFDAVNAYAAADVAHSSPVEVQRPPHMEGVEGEEGKGHQPRGRPSSTRGRNGR